LVLVIHYFGFPHRAFPAAQVKERGAFIVEDASQSLFLPQVFPESSCILYSPRKFLGVPDGGVLVSQGDLGLEPMLLAAPPRAWWKLAVAVSQSRRDADLTGLANGWFGLFQEYEASYPVGLYGISDLSCMLLQAGIDYDAIRSRRRQNYLTLLRSLGACAIYPQLCEDVTPLGFPVCVPASLRDAILQQLYARSIYPPVHWRITGVVPPVHQDSHNLSHSMMTLICDQRYTRSDMERQAAAFEAAVSSEGKR
jgi:dTDP-4-amino-4,6-dideoxygalactose transaminase